VSAPRPMIIIWPARNAIQAWSTDSRTKYIRKSAIRDKTAKGSAERTTGDAGAEQAGRAGHEYRTEDKKR
jgi:hypothetical protein